MTETRENSEHFGGFVLARTLLVIRGDIKRGRIWVNEIRSERGEEERERGGYRLGRRDKKRVISHMNLRVERKLVVIRVSLRRARSSHYSWFIQTRAARFYYFLVTF